MKRINALILTLIITLTVLSGCMSFQGNERTQSEENLQIEENSQSEDSTEGDRTSVSLTDINEEPLFKYDKYMITVDARNYLTEREYALYKQMIDSILSHNGVVEGFETDDEFFKVWSVLLFEFVPVRNIIQTYLNSEEPFIYKEGTATLKFIGDKETCDRNYAAFEDIMNEALSLIKEDDTDWERIAKLYLYVSNNMAYGSPYETYGVENDLYSCIVYELGACTEYAYFLNMLANQIGFETIDGRSLRKNGYEGADHSWSMICVEGQWYHFDACWQASLFSQETMDYFAFSTQERYDSLANNNIWGIPGEVEMFNQDDYSYERTELPHCEDGMSGDDRVSLYFSVIDEYLKGVSKDIPEDMIIAYIDTAIIDVQDAIANGEDVGISFEIEDGTLNSAVRDLIMNYSPQDMENYPEIKEDAEQCKYRSLVLKHIDQTDLKGMMLCIMKESIVVDRTVELVIE